MNFEEALRYELNSINEIKNKIYPLYAPKDTTAPFLVYRKNKLKYLMTVDCRRNGIEAEYLIVLISKSYAEAQNISNNIMGILFNMFARQIGDNGPYIQSIDITYMGDEYEYETDLIRSNFILQVNY